VWTPPPPRALGALGFNAAGAPADTAFMREAGKKQLIVGLVMIAAFTHGARTAPTATAVTGVLATASEAPTTSKPVETRQTATIATVTITTTATATHKVIAPPKPSATVLSKPGCDPAYTLDQNGEKHFKPECF